MRGQSRVVVVVVVVVVMVVSGVDTGMKVLLRLEVVVRKRSPSSLALITKSKFSYSGKPIVLSVSENYKSQIKAHLLL